MSTAHTPSAQHPLGSGFGPKSTAAEVLRGLDLSGRLALVTGGYSGIGVETTRALSNAGATVIVPARRAEAARESVGALPGVQLETLDLGDLASVAALADRLLQDGRPIDVVIDSAGIMACPETRIGDGWEAQFATNHLGHFALVNRIWPLLADGGARVVSVSSRGHQRSSIRWDDIDFLAGYDKWQAYGQAKTANVLFAVWLDQMGRDSGVRAFAVHPGGILTPLQRHLEQGEMQQMGWVDEHGNPTDPSRFKTPEQGAATQLWAATTPRLDGVGGVYCEDCDVAVVDDEGSVSGVRSYAIDPAEAERLWALSAERTGVDAFASA
jgi:NAD(P)-dependent dehydrogenase (short-subunit alcohol dehydrogenase family)